MKYTKLTFSGYLQQCWQYTHLKKQINTAIIQLYGQTALILQLWLVSLKSILVVFSRQFVLFSRWILFIRKHHHLLEIIVCHSQTFYYKPQRNVVFPTAKKKTTINEQHIFFKLKDLHKTLDLTTIKSLCLISRWHLKVSLNDSSSLP